ncbi:glycosyltransferase family 2 protein [Natrarchaeobius chitinivorans]|uniref:Glycosyltransferase family 2 protein n=1 Tax=Natrarchaeobius chitinivorans TaxID=1679083 RepID=A0A3N6PE01_NATCH|nr:glycosyltransferase family 2 protein [Natrarchaeobius chitinivorans]RQG95375.1 glycosyltransferase family 2 protein [Natrarchaeobius chitinivorans]
MYRGQRVGVVMPACNEEGFVGDVIGDMPTFVDRIYAIDDCSTDGTWREILAAAREDRDALERKRTARDRPARDRRETTQRTEGVTETARAVPDEQDSVLTDGGVSVLAKRATVHDPIGRVVPIRHPENRGAGAAIKTGYLAALEDGVDAAVTVDADGQMDLEQMSRLLDPLVEGTADYAKGNRLQSSEYRASMPRFRLFGNAILTVLTKFASGYWKTMDPQNGYTAISREALEAVDVEGLYEYYGYCNDLLVKLNVNDMAVADVAMPAVYGEEESSIAYTEYVPKVSTMLFRNFLWRLRTKHLVRGFHPLVLLYPFGVVTGVIGAIGVLQSLVTLAGTGSVSYQGTASAVVLVVGIASLLFAIGFDVDESEHLETQVGPTQ